MFVATPISVIVRVKPKIASFLIPNCPAASATFAISVAAAGISLDILRVSSEKNWNSVSSAVFQTTAKANAPTPFAVIGAVTYINISYQHSSIHRQ